MIIEISNLCNDAGLNNILVIVKRILSIIQLVAPILCIVSLIILVFRILINPDTEKGNKKIINAIIALVIIFFIPTLINAVFGLLGNSSKFSSCWNNSKDVIDTNSKYIEMNNGKKKITLPDGNKYGYGKNNGYGKAKGSPAIAELAVRVAPIAEPDETKVFAPHNFHHDSISAKCGKYYTPNPWYPPSQVDPRYKDFEKIMDATMNSSRPGNKAYGSCAQAAAGIIRATVDPDFETSNPDGQIQYLRNNPDKWTLVYQMKPGEKFDVVCKPGDLLVTNQGWTHSMIYVGKEIAGKKFPGTKGNIFQAGYSDCDHARYPRIDYMDTTPVPFGVYRPTGKGKFKYSPIDVEKVLGR